jgi:pimeloyl-ACP methyl ester carboxylesterase
MDMPEPYTNRSEDTTTWSPPLPAADGFDHLVVETPGLRNHVAVVGDGDPVVLLHGFPQHWWQWRNVAPVIAAAGYRVYCPDLRGAGWTVADDPKVERTTRLHDLLALLDVLDIERAHVLSHDMGSITAIQLTYDHPERVRAAVQLSVPPFFMSFSPRSIPGFRHLPAFIWHASGASLVETFSRRTWRTRCRRTPSRPTWPPSVARRSTPRCVRWYAAWSCARPGAWRGAPTVAGG